MPQPPSAQESKAPAVGDIEALMKLVVEIAELTEQAARSVREQATAGCELPLELAEYFEQLANNHLDIAKVVASLPRSPLGS